MSSEQQPPAGLERLHQAMAARVAQGQVPGLVILLARGEDVVVDAIGHTAFGSDEPMRRDTVFRIASMTKPILALAAMMLVDDGTLALGEPVERLLPELADRRVLRRIDGPLDETVPAQRAITLEDLLTFRMGHGLQFDPTPITTAAEELQLVMGQPDPRTPHGPDEWIKRFGTLPLMSQPGERWLYNTGSLVLGVLLARAAGQSLPELFRTRIFEPLGMHETGFSLPAEKTARLPSYYMTNFQTGQLEVLSLSAPAEWTTPPVFPSGAAGLLSTVDDYLAFARLLMNRGVHAGQQLVSEESVRLMTTNHLTLEQIAGAGPVRGGRGGGLGMSVVPAPDGAGRYGWEGGYGTSWFNDPEHNLIAIVMTQVSDFLWSGALTEFAQLAIAGDQWTVR
jgi:CubicO group peptidase (beta-lactamase class C family)